MVAVLILAGCAGGPSSDALGDGGSSGVGPGAPAGSTKLWIDPTSAAAKQVVQWRSQGRFDDARQLEKISRQPTATWVSGDLNKVEGQTRDLTEQATADHATPVITAYNIPYRDCGQYSGGGASSDEQYRRWVASLARGLGGHLTVIVLEPDALAQGLSNCERQGQTGRREGLLKGAVTTLTQAGARVYIDAGNPGFVTDVGKLATGLRQSGIGQAAGFALNVSNFKSTDEVVAFGQKVSDLLGGSRFIIDTSRNGNGNYAGPEQSTWCNPPGRALGAPPTRQTGIANVDAFLWVKHPGESDGNCRSGAPKAGEFWPDYALALAKNTRGD